jgi:hypothetical protein
MAGDESDPEGGSDGKREISGRLTGPGVALSRSEPSIVARGRLVSAGPGTWTRLELNARSSALLGSRGKVRIRGTLNGHAFESVAVPDGGGTHSILVTKPIQAAAGVGPGDRVEAKFGVAPGPRRVVVPPELSSALRGSRSARAMFERLAPSHRRAWAEYVAAAKGAETRERRALKAVESLALGVKQLRP